MECFISLKLYQCWNDIDIIVTSYTIVNNHRNHEYRNGVIVVKTVVEVCAGSYEDAWNAQKGGASRIELNSALYMGGCTPSLGTLLLTKKVVSVPVIVMIRPRGGGFHYSDKEKEVMWEDTEMMLKHGADGIAFGCLDCDGNIDVPTCKRMIDLIHSFGKEAVFHRAFDCVRDPFQSIEILISLGVERVLTSGLESTAFKGKHVLKQLQNRYGDQIEILAGSGIHAKNVIDLMEYTGIAQVHSSCKGWVYDGTAVKNHVSFTYALDEHACEYDVVDASVVQNLTETIQLWESRMNKFTKTKGRME